MARFDGKVALVTGAASGIGAAIARRLRAEGARVVSADVAPVDTGDDDGLVAVRADVTDADAVAGAVATAVDRFGRLDMAFGVAGAARFGTIAGGEDEDWRWTVDLILHGSYLTVRHAARAMRETGGGAIVLVSSLNAHVPLYGGSSYAAGKAASENLAKSAALELADDRIRVNAVLPGLVATPLTWGFRTDRAVNGDFLARIPQRRPAQPEEIAGPCLYLASDDASYVTGTSLAVDGGWEISNYPDLRPLVHGEP